MAKEYNINVPILTIQPAEQIIDYLTGKAQLAIVNPWFDLPGIQKPTFPNFLASKNIPGQRPGYQIMSPQIVYKTQSGNFTNKIVFTDDDGSNDLTTSLRFFPLAETKLSVNDYVNKFKVLQKVPSSRGILKQDSTSNPIINECVVNYQLSQAYEMCLLCKMLCFNPKPDDTDLTMLTKFAYLINSKVNQQQSEVPQETQKRINDYIKFNQVPAPGTLDQRYIKTYNATMAKTFGRAKPKPQSIIDIFADDISMKRQYIIEHQSEYQNDPNQVQYNKIFESYANLISISNFQYMGSACYVKEYTGNSNGQSYKGQSIYTDYVLKCADKSSQKTMRKVPEMGNQPPTPMTVQDYLDLVSAPGIGTPDEIRQPAQKAILAKIFMSIDFDYRVYSSVTGRQSTGVRYTIHLIFYKPNTFNSLNAIDYGNVQMGVDEDYSSGQSFSNDNVYDVNNINMGNDIPLGM